MEQNDYQGFWSSSQNASWRFSKAELQKIHDDSDTKEQALIRQWPLPPPRLLNVWLQQQMLKLGKRLSVQQPAIATATMFVRRFYLKVHIRRTNPYLLLATTLYLACKVEEIPQHIKMVMTEARHLWSDFILPLPALIGECEFLIISELDAQLLLHHPYRPLNQLQEIIGLTQEEHTLAWSFVNDHYVTDLPFLYPPHVIAAAAVSFTLTLRPSHGTASSGPMLGRGNQASVSGSTETESSQSKLHKLKDWLVTSNIDVEGMIDCTQEMISLYVVWEQYSDKDCRDQINRFIKDRKLERLGPA